jgi:hypothetical protein
VVEIDYVYTGKPSTGAKNAAAAKSAFMGELRECANCAVAVVFVFINE